MARDGDKCQTHRMQIMNIGDIGADGTSGFLEKIITAAQSSYNVVENLPSVPGFPSALE